MDFGDLDYKEEWKALQVTYPELNLSNEPPHKGSSFQLRIQINLNQDYIADVVEVTDDTPRSSEGSIRISHMPPIFMNLLLPPLYPHEEPPEVISLWSMYNWLPDYLSQKLIEDLQEIWNRERSVVLALWLDHIQDGRELLESLELLNNDKILLYSHTSEKNYLLRSLKEYNDVAKEADFNNNKYRCPICFDRLQGVDCIALSFCGHVVCKTCLKAGWSLHISEGRPELVACPDPHCVKLGRSPFIEDIQAVLSQEEVVRWQWLLRKKETEKDPSIVFCPQLTCQRPVRKDLSVEEESSGWERLRMCECGFAFCVYCRRTWHGPHLACPLPSSMDFVKTYLALHKGSPERLVLEERHGQNNLTKLVAKYQEDQLNREWFERETMACPGCQVRVEKSMGCNHMTCAKCGQHFCFRCGAKIRATDPYLHFSTRGLPCYSKLFDRENVDMEGFAF